MKYQDFLDELGVISDFYDEVKQLHLQSGVASSATSTGSPAGGIATTQASRRVQRSNSQFVPVNRGQVLSESVIHHLNALWERYVCSYFMKQRSARYILAFPNRGTVYNGTGELRVLTKCLKHEGKFPNTKLLRINPSRFQVGILIVLRYDDAERYMSMVKVNMTTLGGRQRLP